MKRTLLPQEQQDPFSAQQDLRELGDEELKIATGGRGATGRSYDPYRDDPMVRYFLKHPGPPAHLDSVQ
jgi:hypothetical protein